MFKRILVASDGSGTSLKAARIAGEVAKTYSAALTVATVAYFPRVYASDVSSDMMEGYLQEWKRVLKSTVDAVKAIGADPEGRLLREEEPARALLDEAERGGYDLLVVGRTGAGSPGSKMMGGVSRKLAEGAACSVLIVR
ncbi:MAG: universal stress protein [Candidatus Eisenbacteria bacterium]